MKTLRDRRFIFGLMFKKLKGEKVFVAYIFFSKIVESFIKKRLENAEDILEQFFLRLS